MQSNAAITLPPGTAIGWAPHAGPQMAFVTCPVEDVLFGGARGGGKSAGLLGDWLIRADRDGAGARGVIFRKTYPQLEEVEAASLELFPKFGALYNVQRHAWRFPSGATLKLRYLENDRDADEYQGHSYCVGVGTGIVMGDGSSKRIEDVRVGEMVMTLEGSKVVTAVVEPYEAPCVTATVFDSWGRFLGEQVQPVWHPVLTIDGVRRGRMAGLLQNVRRWYRRMRAPVSSGASRFCESRGTRGWFSFEEGVQNDCRESSGEPGEVRPLPAWSAHVALHVRSVQSMCARQGTSCAEPIGSDFRGKSKRPLSGSSTVKLPQWMDQLRQLELSRSIQLTCDLGSPNGEACALGARRTSAGLRVGCLIDPGSGDAPAHLLPENDRGISPSRASAAIPFREWIAGASDTIPRRTHLSQGTYVHPYTGEERRLSERILEGRVLLEPCGVHLVADLTVADANHYISVNGLVNKNSWVAFDELTNWASPVPVDKLRACLRSAQRVPCVLRATGNPGGVGNNWVKARYLDPAQPYMPHYAKNESGAGGTWRVFIPSTLDDNPSLAQDPGYWQRVEAAAAGNAALLKAWRYGDWNVIAGGYFDDLWQQSIHVVEPFPIPTGWRIDRAFDWGSTKPYACLWFAESDGEEVVLPGNRRRAWPRGSLCVIGEEYGWNGKPNEGLRLANAEIARRILTAEEQLGIKGRVQPGPADNQIFDVINGTSIADEMARVGVRWTRSIKGKGSRVTGWQAIRGFLQASRRQPMEAPGLFVSSTCRNTIRTLPVMPRDQRRPDDVDTEAEDHLCDVIRYRCLAQRHEVAQHEILGM